MNSVHDIKHRKFDKSYDITDVISYLQNKKNYIEKEDTNHELILHKKIQNIDKEFIHRIKIKCNGRYPFIKPIVYINDTYYNDFFRTNLIVQKKYIKLLINEKCLCCKSILCSNAWSPGMDIKYILDELDSKIEIRINAIKLFYLDKITIKYFGPYFIDIKTYLI